MRLGVLNYINSLPVTLALERGSAEAVKAPPAELNQMAISGQLDLTAVSSVVYLRNRQKLAKVPDFCIASDGPVQSVRLFSRVPFEELGRGPVWMTAESETSRALLLQLYPGLEPYDRPGKPNLEGRIPAALRIGDSALEEVPRGQYVADLGQLWKEKTGLPMVFAVWVTRPGLEETCRDMLESSYRWGLEHFDQVLDEAHRRTGLSIDRLRDYYSVLRFRLDGRARKGLEEFAKGEALCLNS